jgi:hypothetical protein
MAFKRVVLVAMATVLLTGLGASANQPDVKVTDLKPQLMFDTSNALRLLMVDPWAETELRIEPVTGYATLDVDADPFVQVAQVQ